MTTDAKVVWELSYFFVFVLLCALHTPFGVHPLFFRFAHISVSFVYMAHLFSMTYSCLTCYVAFCFCVLCPCSF